VALLATGVAGAHPQYSPTESNRYLKISLAGGGSLRLAFTLMVGEAPALAVRRAADKNGDGQVDEVELGGYAAKVAAAVASGLELTVDGARREVEWEPPLVGLADRRVGPLPLSIDVVGRLPVRGPGPHLIGVADHTSQHGLADQTGESELRLEEGPGTRLLAAWHGQEDGARSTRFVWNGPDVAGDRTIAFRFVDDRAPRPRRRPPIALVGALVGAAIAGVLAWRRRRPTPTRIVRPRP